MNNLLVIPARGGSKRLPQKNIRTFVDKPLIAWTIETALKAALGDVVVSTDNEQIAAISKEYGAKVPFLRPAELATDKSPSIDAVKHCLVECERTFQKSYDNVFLLQPTSPLRSINSLQKAYQEFINLGAESIVSVCELEHPTKWASNMAMGKPIDQFISGLNRSRSQDLDKEYRLNGAIYITRSEYVRASVFLSKVNTFPFLMSREESVDIDEKFDFEFAEFLARR